jgi:hypothetical protein
MVQNNNWSNQTTNQQNYWQAQYNAQSNAWSTWFGAVQQDLSIVYFDMDNMPAMPGLRYDTHIGGEIHEIYYNVSTGEYVAQKITVFNPDGTITETLTQNRMHKRIRMITDFTGQYGPTITTTITDASSELG